MLGGLPREIVSQKLMVTVVFGIRWLSYTGLEGIPISSFASLFGHFCCPLAAGFCHYSLFSDASPRPLSSVVAFLEVSACQPLEVNHDSVRTEESDYLHESILEDTISRIDL